MGNPTGPNGSSRGVARGSLGPCAGQGCRLWEFLMPPARRGGGKRSTATAGERPGGPRRIRLRLPRVGDTGVDVGPCPRTPLSPPCHRPHRARQEQGGGCSGRSRRRLGGFSPDWHQPPAVGNTGNRGAVPSLGQPRGTGGAGPGAQPRPGPAPSRPGSRPLPSHLRHSSPGRSAAPPGGGVGEAPAGHSEPRSRRAAPAPPPAAFAPAPTWALQVGARPGRGDAGVSVPRPSRPSGPAGGGIPTAPREPGPTPLPPWRCPGPGRRGAVAAGAGPLGGSGGVAAMAAVAALRRLVPAVGRAAGRYRHRQPAPRLPCDRGRCS